MSLTSRLIAEELGYPELLLDKKYQKNKLLEEYSYAKYYKNQLLAQSGSFQYSLDSEYYTRTRPDKFEWIQPPDLLCEQGQCGNGKPARQPRFLTSWFLFLYLSILLPHPDFCIRLPIIFQDWDGTLNSTLKTRYSFPSLQFYSFHLLLVGGGTIYFSIQQYQKKQHDLLSEKIQSVYIELDHMLAYLRTRYTPTRRGTDYDNLNQLLIRFSDVFYSDINLYDPKGNLLATSRSEIFDQGMQGEKMNPVAYDKMVKEKQAEFIHREKIGNLSYLSAYVPFVNAEEQTSGLSEPALFYQTEYTAE